MRKILFISNNCIGAGLSGGDRIWIELLRGWRKRAEVTLMGSEEARAMAEQRGVSGGPVIVSDERNKSPNPYTIAGMFRHYMRRLRKGYEALEANASVIGSVEAVYSASDAYPDFLPALRLKKKRPELSWIAGYYLFVPQPFGGQTPYKGKNRMRGCLYWLMQILSFRLINRYADFVFVTSEPDVERFVNRRREKNKVVVVRGGVDISPSEKHLKSGSIVPLDKRQYDACFIGRLHYQKGALEIVDVWKHVVEEKSDARLVMIGDGPLEQEIRSKIAVCGLERNIDMVGFLDGEEKYGIFKESKMIVHPATYDSGGMAAAEGMAWGLPAVSFDLEALKSYYPRGMLKTARGDLRRFAANILSLLKDGALYQRVSSEARDLIVREWDWNKRARQLYYAVFGNN